MFGEQFVSFVQYMSGSFEQISNSRFKKNYEFLRNKSLQLNFPDYNKYPYHVREIFEYYKALIHKDDLYDLAQGTLYKENIINVYFKILEKVHLVLQSSFNYQRATRSSVDMFTASQ